MDETRDDSMARRLDRLAREARRWRWSAAAALLGAVAILAGGDAGPGKVEAQQAGGPKGDEPPRPRMEYLQSQVSWSRMHETLNEWEAKGWEAFQIVPIASPTVGIGGPMQVAVVVRRPVK